MKPLAESTLVDLLDRAVSAHPEGLAVVDRGRRYSYRELDCLVEEFASGLDSLGVRPGDRVALWMVNRAEWLVAYFAVARLGAILVGVNTRYTAKELEHVLASSGASVLITQDEFRSYRYIDTLGVLCPELALAEPGAWRAERLPGLREVVVTGSAVPAGARPFEGVVAAGRRLIESAVKRNPVPIGPDSLVLLLYTSGTTSSAKGVMLTHRNIVANNVHSGEHQRLGPRDRMLMAMPLFTPFSCVHALIATLGHMGTMVLLDSFSPSACMRLIEEEGCTAMFGVDAVFRDLLDAPDRGAYDLGSMRTGVGVLSMDTAGRIYNELGFKEYHQGWGMTENGAVATITSISDPVDMRMRSVGSPVPGMELKLADPATGRRAEDGEVGEILLRGAYITQGYWNDPEATASLIDADGWLHSGDLGVIAPGGYLLYKGRFKDVIKSSGFNFAPLEVEEVICALRGVRAAAVVGVPDERAGEVGYAFVVRDGTEGATLDQETVRSHCASELAKYKVPRIVEFIEGDLPRNDMKKVLKNQLRSRALLALHERTTGE